MCTQGRQKVSALVSIIQTAQTRKRSRPPRIVGGREVLFWHTSCRCHSVAKKYYNPGLARAAAEIAAINLRMAANPLAGVRIPPRVRKVPTVRRRLPITILTDSAQAVNIRHAAHNLGGAASEIQPAQSRRV
jgi:transposase InsO family protein